MIGMITSGLLFAATSAMAAEGQTEMTINGLLDNTTSNGSDSSTIMVNMELGKYFSPYLVGKFNYLMMGTDDGTNSSTTLGLGGGIKFYFMQSSKGAWVPFVVGDMNAMMYSATSGFSTSDGTGLGTQYGIGVSNFVTEDVSMDITLKAYSQSFEINGFTLEQSGTRMLFGITVRQ